MTLNILSQFFASFCLTYYKWILWFLWGLKNNKINSMNKLKTGYPLNLKFGLMHLFIIFFPVIVRYKRLNVILKC